MTTTTHSPVLMSNSRTRINMADIYEDFGNLVYTTGDTLETFKRKFYAISSHLKQDDNWEMMIDCIFFINACKNKIEGIEAVGVPIEELESYDDEPVMRNGTLVITGGPNQKQKDNMIHSTCKNLCTMNQLRPKDVKRLKDQDHHNVSENVKAVFFDEWDTFTVLYCPDIRPIILPEVLSVITGGPNQKQKDNMIHSTCKNLCTMNQLRPKDVKAGFFDEFHFFTPATLPLFIGRRPVIFKGDNGYKNPIESNYSKKRECIICGKIRETDKNNFCYACTID